MARSADYELISRINASARPPVEKPDPTRMAGDAMASALGFFGKDGKLGKFVMSPRGIATGGGLAVLGGLLSAAQEFNNPDPTRTTTQNAAAGIGSGLGTTGGAIAGGVLGSALGPVGTLVGSGLGAAIGGASGKGLADLVTGLLAGSPEQRALRLAERQGELALELDRKRAETMMPLQATAAKIAQEMQMKAARDAMLNNAMAYTLQRQSESAAAQQLAATQTLLGGLGL